MTTLPPAESSEDWVVGVRLSINGLPRLLRTVQDVGGDVEELPQLLVGGSGGRLLKGRFTLDFKRLDDVEAIEFGSMVSIGTSS